ncbi:hypothetical protein E2C01_034474 [Portunus trituberculatus]|uniref:Uncharacterized protein n=1 Tax=Portunus trituberculatus TaxID=210409 RepID=A0A5B7F0Q1_PORTR|nr:hypothetical protein [Portunus trituberculatus]
MVLTRSLLFPVRTARGSLTSPKLDVTVNLISPQKECIFLLFAAIKEAKQTQWLHFARRTLPPLFLLLPPSPLPEKVKRDIKFSGSNLSHRENGKILVCH